MDDLHPLPDGGTVRVIGPIVIVTREGRCTAYCRRCGGELATWPAGTRGPGLRCSCRDG